MTEERFRKLFIGGIETTVTEEELRTYFERYGNVTDCVVLKDWSTGRSRGFGFVTFDDPASVDLVQANRPHRFRGREVELRRAVPKQYFERLYGHLTVKKMFVGGLGDAIDADDLREYFSRYGSIRNIDVIVDRETRRKRGFAFVEFDDYDPVDKIVLQEYHTIKGKSVDVKKAMTRYETRLLKQAQSDRELLESHVRSQNMASNFMPPGFAPIFSPFPPVDMMNARPDNRNFPAWGRARLF